MFRALAGLTALCVLWTLGIWVTGGFTIEAAGIRIASTTVWRPLILGLSAAAALLIFYGPRAVISAGRQTAGRIRVFHVTAAIALALALAGIRWGTWTASGPDPYAYVSQAAMWREGASTVAVPLAESAPWPQPVQTFTPFGYRAAPDRSAALIPMTTPGLPLAMAGLQSLLGHWAAFLITPAAAAALIVVTFLLGRRVRSDEAGGVAAWLVATSPVTLFMTMWPMTDVPAAACTALMLYLLLSPSPAGALGAGVTAAAGLLLRPTFATIAAGAMVWLIVDRRRLLLFAAGVLPGLALLFWINDRWFGSPMTFGYGTPGQLLVLNRFWTNVVRYGTWIRDTSPLAAIGLIGLIAYVLNPPPGTSRRTVLLFAIIAAAACLPYLFYEPFTEWWYLRFLLPAWPPILIGAGLFATSPRLRGRAARTIVALTVLLAGIAGIGVSQRRGVFDLNERRYATIARIVAGMTDSSAVVLTVQHAGTIRYYAGRQTVRWDVLDPAWLDRAVAWLAEQGRHPYLLIEDWEEAAFESRFGAGNQLGRLSYSPLMAWQSKRADGWIYLFDPLTRDAATVNPGLEVELAEPFTASPAAEPWPKAP